MTQKHHKKMTPQQNIEERSRRAEYASYLQDYLPNTAVEVTKAQRTEHPDKREVRHSITAIIGGQVFHAQSAVYVEALRDIVAQRLCAVEDEAKGKNTILPPLKPDEAEPEASLFETFYLLNPYPSLRIS
jgi:hypothetical protein